MILNKNFILNETGDSKRNQSHMELIYLLSVFTGVSGEPSDSEDKELFRRKVD